MSSAWCWAGASAWGRGLELCSVTLLPVPGLTNLSSSCLPSGVQAGGPASVECPSSGNTVTITPGAEIVSASRWRSDKRRWQSDAGVGEVVSSSLVRNLLHARILTAQNIFFFGPYRGSRRQPPAWLGRTGIRTQIYGTGATDLMHRATQPVTRKRSVLLLVENKHQRHLRT